VLYYRFRGPFCFFLDKQKEKKKNNAAANYRLQYPKFVFCWDEENQLFNGDFYVGC
jgi:hypothetical protein